MYVFKRLMVALDLTVMDQTLVRYTAFLAHLINPEQIYFFNVQPELDLPDELRKEFPMFDQPVDEHFKDEMRKTVKEYFANYERFEDRIDFKIVEGSVRKQMLHWAHVKKVDLLIMGRKAEVRGSGMAPAQVVRKVGCSVLFVPENTVPNLTHILVGSDFSTHSAQAVKEALELRERHPNPVAITLQHVFQVPLGYYKSGRTEAQFAELMESHAAAHLREFVDEHEVDLKGVQVVYTFDQKKESPANVVNDYAHAHQVDLIVIATRGRTALTALFMGSVAEKLVRADIDIPLLLSKDGSKAINLLEALERL